MSLFDEILEAIREEWPIDSNDVRDWHLEDQYAYRNGKFDSFDERDDHLLNLRQNRMALAVKGNISSHLNRNSIALVDFKSTINIEAVSTYLCFKDSQNEHESKDSLTTLTKDVPPKYFVQAREIMDILWLLSG